MTATADGSVTAVDFVEFLAAVKGARAHSYRKLLDGGAAEFVMDEHEVMTVGTGLKDLQQEAQASLAIVLSDEGTHRLARMLGIVATGNGPMRLFRTRRSAERWLAR